MKRTGMVLIIIGLFVLTGCARATASATEPPIASSGDVDPTYEDDIQPVFVRVCGECHGIVETSGLNLTTYETAMRGGHDGPVIVPGAPDSSELVKRQREGHYGQLSEQELELVIEWISTGAPE